MSEATKYLSDKATRQEHLADLAEWLNIQINVWAREFRQHHSPDDKLKLAVYEAALSLVKVRNPFDAVIRDYDRARAKQHCRMTRQRRDFNTIHEQKAIAFYTDAITKIEAL